MSTTNTETFETETCTRCHGSGRYSYCQSYGDRCFRCRGRKTTLTARGAAAKAYYESLCTKPARDITVGDSVWFDGFMSKSKWFTVAAIESAESGRSWIGGVEQPATPMLRFTDDVDTWTVGADSPMRVRQSPEQRAEKMAIALAYQASLTKAGTVRKMRRTAA